jgi:hypothetical protein
MRFKSLVAVALVVIAAVAAITVACSSGASCTPGKLDVQLQFRGTAIDSDTVTVTALDPQTLGVNQSFSRTPGDTSVMNLEIGFPNGYPANQVVTLLFRAYGSATLLGENTATIHLDPGCSTGSVSIFTSLIDASPTTD